MKGEQRLRLGLRPRVRERQRGMEQGRVSKLGGRGREKEVESEKAERERERELSGRGQHDSRGREVRDGETVKE